MILSNVLDFLIDGFEPSPCKADSLANDLNRPASLPVIRRTVRFTANETVVGRAPVIQGLAAQCKQKMTTNKFTIGLSVNGIYRIIDVIGDLGSFAAHSTYTVEIVVAEHQ